MTDDQFTESFDTPYFYLQYSEVIAPNYTLYDTFSLKMNLTNEYPQYDITFINELKGEEKMYLIVKITTSSQLNEQQKREIIRRIDHYTSGSRLFVILFPFDKPIYTSSGRLVPTMLMNQLIQLVDLKRNVNADDREIWNMLNSNEMFSIDALNQADFDKIDPYQMELEYEFNELGLFVNLASTGFYNTLHSLLFTFIYNQIIQLYERGICICDSTFAERWNLTHYKHNSFVITEWKIPNLFINRNMSEILLQIQESNSLMLLMNLDDIDRHWLSSFLNTILDEKDFIFFNNGMWINVNKLDYSFLNSLSHQLERAKSIQSCEIKFVRDDDEDGDVTVYNTTIGKIKSLRIC